MTTAAYRHTEAWTVSCPLYWEPEARDGTWLIADGHTGELVATNFPSEAEAKNWIAAGLMHWARCHPEHIN
jgi:hypothetical protein